MRLAVIEHLVVDLVGKHRDVGMALEPGHELVDLRFRGDAAGGICR